MLKLTPIQSDKVWGYEQWIASVHPNGFQKDFADFAGTDYPLLVKVIQADESLSVQVHPDDEKAVELEGEGNRGKTECWYVLEAQPGARLVYGLKSHTGVMPSKEQLICAIKENRLEQFLNFVEVKKGDFIFIPAGTVHAIGGGLRLMEVQQSCDITYRMYDWGRPREIHVQKAVEVTKNDGLNEISSLEKFSCPYFNLERKVFGGKYSYKNNGDLNDTVLVFICAGNGTIKSSDGKSFCFTKENIFAFKACQEVTFESSENCEVIFISAV